MSLVVTAEEAILDQLQSFEQGTHVGLIVGQVTVKRLLVVHIAPTPEQSNTSSLPNLQEVNELGVGEHSRYVTRLLPGGLWVLGVFIVSPDDVFSSSNFKLVKKVLAAVDKSVSEGFPICGRNPSQSCLILHYNSATKQYQSKISEPSGEVKNVDFKFQSTTQTWRRVDSQYLVLDDMRWTLPQFPKNVQDLMNKLAKSVESSIVHIEGKRWEPTLAVEKLSKGNEALEATFLQPCSKVGSGEMKVFDTAAQMHISGSIPSRVYLNPRCTVEEAAAIIRQDVIRSLAARLEMHLDSLVEETDGEEKDNVVHVPPRRVLIRPSGWTIQLSDFLFPGESSEETMGTFKELLNLDVVMDDIETEFEPHHDGSSLGEVVRDGASAGKKTATVDQNVPPFVIVLAFLTLLIGFLIHYLISYTRQD